MINYYGIILFICQCVMFGMMVLYEGCIYCVLVVIQECKWVYLYIDVEIICFSDCVIDVFLDGYGNFFIY